MKQRSIDIKNGLIQDIVTHNTPLQIIFIHIFVGEYVNFAPTVTDPLMNKLKMLSVPQLELLLELVFKLRTI